MVAVEPVNFELQDAMARAPRPVTLAQTGLTIGFLADLLSKHLALSGVLSFGQLTQRLALAGPIVEQILQWMRKEGRVEVRARLAGEQDLRFGLTDRGRAEAMDAQLRGGYVGPTPVPLADFAAMVRRQSVHSGLVTRQSMHHAFRNVVIEPSLLDQLGPALNSGRALFIYGTAGTGKTFIARRLANALPGLVLIPHAIAVNETVIRMFDPLVHLEVEGLEHTSAVKFESGHDPRYALCERPVIVSGGELTAEMLEVHFNANTREFSAPLQMKASNGLLLIDDLGRQRVAPQALFNRWIVPMEEKRDYLTASGGQHFSVPFDVVLVFSTNLDPIELADEAFLRRLGSKICFRPVSAPQYRKIWNDVCAERKATCAPETVEHVIVELHAMRGKAMLPCHPRDLIGMALDRSGYFGGAPDITIDSVEWAWNNYFVEEKSE